MKKFPTFLNLPQPMGQKHKKIGGRSRPQNKTGDDSREGIQVQ